MFLFVCQHSSAKYEIWRTSTEIKKNRIEKVQYPSDTVCVENAMKTGLDISYENNFSFNDTRNKIKENLYNRNETFFFVNQASSKSLGYPCITSKDSSDPGRPCSFPFEKL